MSHAFKIGTLDHVAIRVQDFDRSIAWYEKVLGLTPLRTEKWGDYPVFLLSGTTGIALFPESASTEHIQSDIDHFAFTVSNEDFLLSRKHYDALEIPYEIKDHHYFHSIYTQDPDGHKVELTTLVVPAESFYGTKEI